MRIPCQRGLRLPFFVFALSGLLACAGDADPDDGQDPSATPAEVPGTTGAPGARESRGAESTGVDTFLPTSFPSPGQERLDAAEGMDLDRAFQAVARGIRYEPYSGVLRGAALTSLLGSGNDLDQAILLAHLLERSGYRTRFVRGFLGAENQSVLLRGMTPPEVPPFDFTPDYRPYDPSADSELTTLTRDHFWVEVFQTPEWLPLDPSFPRAEAGEAYATAQERFEEIPQELYQTVRISYHEETVLGGEKELGVIHGSALELSLRPISLSVRSVLQSPAGPPERGASPGGITGGIAGALSGGDPPEEEPEPFTVDDLVGISYRRALLEGSAEASLPHTFLLEAERDGGLVREWLEVETTAPGAPPMTSTRLLFDSEWDSGEVAEPPPVRRYGISIVPGPIPLDWLREERRRWSGYLDIDGWSRELEASSELEAGDEAAEAARRLTLMETAAGAGAGHLLALSYAAESDSLSRLVARSTGVVPVWARPRVLISSFETTSLNPDEAESMVSLDLRIDDVEAYPLPGAPSAGSRLFHTARGLQNSVLEGAVVARATGITVPVTTANLMERADEDMDDGILVVSPNGPGTALGELEGLPNSCSPLIEDALARGLDVIIPRRAVRLSGLDRWGWWEMDPVTGKLMGVMENGQHQGMVEYKLSLERVGTNDKMGWGIGAIVGATGTLFLISAKMLEYGEASDQMIADVKKWVQSLLCYTCFSKAEAATSIQATATIGGDCFKQAVAKEEGGVSVSISFCEQYEKGFKCTSGLLLAGLLGEDLPTTPGAEASLGFQFGCDDWKLSGKADDGGVEVQAGKDKLNVTDDRKRRSGDDGDL